MRMCLSSIRSIGRVREVELVLDLADDLLEEVLERDDPLHVAVLVDDDRHVLLLAPEVGEERGEVLRLRDDVRGPQDRLELDRRDAEVVHRAEEVAHVEDADDLVERLAVHRVAREGRVDDRAQSASSGGMSTEIATTSGRGTITAETSFEAKSKTL